MLHACVQRFDVTENLKKICKILGTDTKGIYDIIPQPHVPHHQKNTKEKKKTKYIVLDLRGRVQGTRIDF